MEKADIDLFKRTYVVTYRSESDRDMIQRAARFDGYITIGHIGASSVLLSWDGTSTTDKTKCLRAFRLVSKDGQITIFAVQDETQNTIPYKDLISLLLGKDIPKYRSNISPSEARQETISDILRDAVSLCTAERVEVLSLIDPKKEGDPEGYCKFGRVGNGIHIVLHVQDDVCLVEDILFAHSDIGNSLMYPEDWKLYRTVHILVGGKTFPVRYKADTQRIYAEDIFTGELQEIKGVEILRIELAESCHPKTNQ